MEPPELGQLGSPPSDTLDGATYYWTCKLAQSGEFRVAEIIAIRQIDNQTFWAHLAEACEQDETVPIEHLFSSERLTLLEAAVGDSDDTHFEAIRQRVPLDISNHEIQFFLHYCRE